MSTTIITWRDPADMLPDDEMTVLIALDEGTVTEAWKEDGRWHLGDRLSFPASPDPDERVPRVMAWAEIPDHPFPDDIQPMGWHPDGGKGGEP
jgi:hypothetical protein